MTYDEALGFWYARVNYEVRAAEPGDLKLERMRALLKLLGDPHDRVRLVHVTGTKGKGSTSAMIAAVLRAAGYRVGLFTSPHLSHIEERIQVNGVPISHEELAGLMAEVAPVVRAMEAEAHVGITFFELGPVWEMGWEFGYTYAFSRDAGRSAGVQIVTPRCHYLPMPLGLHGEHQAANAATALATLDRLREGGMPISDSAVQAGLRQVRWPA